MKRVVAVAVLAFVALWPLAHRGLVAVYDVNPWKLAGFAMYTTPTPPVQVVLFERAAGENAEGLAPIDEQTLPPTLRRQLARFRVERHALGALRSPDALGAALLEARRDLEWVVVAVQRMRLDRESARMTSRRDQFVYERSP